MLGHGSALSHPTPPHTSRVQWGTFCRECASLLPYSFQWDIVCRVPPDPQQHRAAVTPRELYHTLEISDDDVAAVLLGLHPKSACHTIYQTVCRGNVMTLYLYVCWGVRAGAEPSVLMDGANTRHPCACVHSSAALHSARRYAIWAVSWPSLFSKFQDVGCDVGALAAPSPAGPRPTERTVLSAGEHTTHTFPPDAHFALLFHTWSSPDG